MVDDLDWVEPDDLTALAFQHTVLCQTCLPYRNPGDAVRRWERSQGGARLEIEAGRVYLPTRDEFIDLGLPYGPKPRLILAHLNAGALRTGSPEIEIITLDPRYFASLQRYAVPLHEHALAALSGNTMALDVYARLAQGLHRIKPGKPQLVLWRALKDQFGWHYGRIDNSAATT